jgi:NAD+ synthase
VPGEHPHPWLSFDVDQALGTVTGFLADYVEDADADGVVVGVSGGVDSATAAGLATQALGPERVEALVLPGPTSPDGDLDHAEAVAEAFGLGLDRVAIDEPADALAEALGVETSERVRGNLQARLRMAVLYAHAGAGDRLVLGTGNKSELLTGYFTKHGDGGVDLLPIGDLYKTQVRELAREVGVPDPVVQRPPTAGLWEGQRDEDELGLAYEDLDVVLAGIEQQFDAERIAREADVPEDEVDRVRGLVREARHKRAPPPVAKLGWRTVGVDWRDAPT